MLSRRRAPTTLKDSQYRGWHYEAKYEAKFRRCILARWRAVKELSQ